MHRVHRRARDVEEAKELVEAGFEYVTGEYDDGGKIFRKRKKSTWNIEKVFGMLEFQIDGKGK